MQIRNMKVAKTIPFYTREFSEISMFEISRVNSVYFDIFLCFIVFSHF